MYATWQRNWSNLLRQPDGFFLFKGIFVKQKMKISLKVEVLYFDPVASGKLKYNTFKL